MIDCGCRNLVMVNRNPPSPAQQLALHAMEERGAKPAVLLANVANVDDMQRVLKTVKQTMPPLRGVFHLAGVLDDGVLLHQTWDRFMSVLAPKRNGAWLLHVLTKDEQLDHFVMFSSIAAVTGSLGQGSYAAANAFLDGLVHYRHALGLPALSVDWGPWADFGMANEYASIERLRQLGIGLLPPAEALALMPQLMGFQDTIPQVAVVALNTPSAAEAQVQPGSLPRVTTHLHTLQATKTEIDLSRLRTMDPASATQEVTRHVRQIMAHILRISTEGLDLETPLPMLGLDSLLAVELKHHVESRYGVGLPLTSLFSNMSIGLLAAYLVEQLTSNSEVSGTQPDAAIGTSQGIRQSGRDIDQLSEEELDAALAELLTAEQGQ
jgi:acyl carrier protein